MKIRRSSFVGAAMAVLVAVGIYGAGPGDFLPDGSLKGSSLTGWRQLGHAEWKLNDGELTAKPGPGGGWLVLDKSYQDVEFFHNFRCADACKTGVLLRAAKTPDGGLKGVYVSLSDGDLAAYDLTLDAQGQEIAARENWARPPRLPEAVGAVAREPEVAEAADAVGAADAADVVRHCTRETGTRSRSVCMALPSVRL